MARTIGAVILIAAIIGVAAFWLLTMPSTISADRLPQRTANLENGRTVFYAGGCAECHATPKQDDRTRLGGGLALTSEFGTFHVPNISPDPNDGIGAWSEAEFVSAVLRGTAPGGVHLYPAFPYPSYAHARLDDVRDLFAFIKTLPAVAGRAPPNELAFPFNIRRAVGLWKLLFFDDATFTPDPAQSAQWNRGAYLVNSFGHCAECHSPRNVLGGIVASQRFAGGPNPEGKGWVPNITQKGLSDWSESDLAYFLETGLTPEGDSAGGSMAQVIRNTSQLGKADREAIAVYIKSLPAVQGPARPPRKAKAE
ncbi:mono/diheme cytochrome c family protein [Rhodopseudomonas thermotolerans]|uniref:Mono/diheme cytochrome c family protein n=2 Tax=Rhodopseudomonas TaxID=1073 RepID=A0A336JK55_9BRAD|nr:MULTISPECIES: cytochrome c [Rhodopseudomonas]RED38073.1 mono/diheme cytochrome c family protein [Rhodopseudomonas pentothenatexigens]REG05266.1 mono/diheme cytochrome c family protein [Rhodopseudomonas thermotolerans]SSW90098.1 mono/diheme cytochrome c family protein [Rhodopseudomonas pentothenatexigens]